jgi:hypothetical protein
MQTAKREYREVTDYTALSSRVLVVAVAQEPIDEWSAYIDGTPGENHEQEYQEVKAHGDKLRYDLAKVLFPEFDRRYTWRD